MFTFISLSGLLREKAQAHLLFWHPNLFQTISDLFRIDCTPAALIGQLDQSYLNAVEFLIDSLLRALF